MLVGIGGYTLIQANIEQTVSLQIPAQEIRYEEQELLEFSLEKIPGYEVKKISLQMDLTTNNTYIDTYLFTSIETLEKSIYTREESTK